MAVMKKSPDHSSNGDDGIQSSTKNCDHQATTTSIVMTAITEEIVEKLDVIKWSSTSDPFRLADMGCSAGPNTFLSVQLILDSEKQTFESSGLTADQMLEFQVFFDDLVFNDFNTLFLSLPTERKYFSAGAPGSFYGRLLPETSLHFVFSSYALQWLSQVRQEVVNEESPTCNKGRVHYTIAPEVVSTAFAAQFARDMGMFLDARATELVEGGMMVLIMPSIPDGIPIFNAPIGILYDYLGSCLMDMVKEGLIGEALVDSFNIPMYAVTPKEITELIQRNGGFTIERIAPTGCTSKPEVRPTGQAILTHLRTGMEGIINKHFGYEIVDELFCRVLHKIDDLMRLLVSSNGEGTQLTVILKRRSHTSKLNT